MRGLKPTTGKLSDYKKMATQEEKTSRKRYEYNTTLIYHNIVLTITVHLFEHNVIRALALYQTDAL